MKASVERTMALLVKGSIDINQGDPQGYTPLMCAAVNGFSRIVRLLLDKGANVALVPDEGATALHASAQDGHVTVTKMLVEAGASLEAKSHQGATPLHMAAGNGHSGVMRVLIEAGADPNCRKWDGTTPIFSAAFRGYLDAIRVLLRAKANPMFPKTELMGKTFVPLDMAAQNGYPEVVLELIQEVGIKGCGGATGGVRALCQAGQQHHVNIMATLTEAGVMDTGEALAVAAGWGREESVKFLLQQHKRRQQRAKRTIIDGLDAYVNRSLRMIGSTPLSSTVHPGGQLCSPRIVRLLIDSGADTALLGASTESGPGRVLKANPSALMTLQLRTLEAIRRLLLQVEAIYAVSWVWPEGGPGIVEELQGTRTHVAPKRGERQLGMIPLIRRRRTRRRDVLMKALSR